MICAATGKRGERVDVSESVKRRESLNRKAQVTHKILSDVDTRSAKRRLASADTPRFNSQQLDQDQAHLASFRANDGKLNEEDKNAIYEQYRCGTPVETLAQRYRINRTLMRQVLNEVRVGRIMELPLDFIPNPQFSSADADNSILAEMPSPDAQVKATRVPSGLSPYFASLYEVPLLTREQEGHLFRKFNYLKFKAAKMRSELDPAGERLGIMDRIERLYEQAVAIKNEIVRANLRLVISIAKRYMSPNRDLWELVSEGNMSLMRAVDKFDFSRGNKVSTYASWAIMKNFARSIPNEQRHQDRFRTSHGETFSLSEEHRSNQYEQENTQRQREAEVLKILDRLGERERKVVVSRFGLEDGQPARTLAEIGMHMGVSKERIRQIEARAMRKLRLAAAEDNLEVPEV